MVNENKTEILTVYNGVDANMQDAEEIAAYASDKYSDCDVEVQSGGQAVYHYIISAE
jgi:hypothetical protein